MDLRNSKVFFKYSFFHAGFYFPSVLLAVNKSSVWCHYWLRGQVTVVYLRPDYYYYAWRKRDAKWIEPDEVYYTGNFGEMNPRRVCHFLLSFPLIRHIIKFNVVWEWKHTGRVLSHFLQEKHGTNTTAEQKNSEIAGINRGIKGTRHGVFGNLDGKYVSAHDKKVS